MSEARTLALRTLLIWILLELVAAAQVRAPLGSSVLWQWLRSVASPVVWAAQLLDTVTGDLIVGLKDNQKMMAEAKQLRAEVESLRVRNLLLREDRETLREIADLLQMVPGMDATSIAGRCVYRNSSIGRMEVMVDAARLLPKDSPAVGAGGLVGRVIHSTRRRCWIELITHPAAAVAVQTADGSVQGLALGTGDPMLAVDYVSPTAELLRGDTLLSSGADGIYPPGMPVATVASIRESDAPFLEVRALPTANFSTIRVVLLLPRWGGSPTGELPP